MSTDLMICKTVLMGDRRSVNRIPVFPEESPGTHFCWSL